jgi:hypothetical protein
MATELSIEETDINRDMAVPVRAVSLKLKG